MTELKGLYFDRGGDIKVDTINDPYDDPVMADIRMQTTASQRRGEYDTRREAVLGRFKERNSLLRILQRCSWEKINDNVDSVLKKMGEMYTTWRNVYTPYFDADSEEFLASLRGVTEPLRGYDLGYSKRKSTALSTLFKGCYQGLVLGCVSAMVSYNTLPSSGAAVASLVVTFVSWLAGAAIKGHKKHCHEIKEALPLVRVHLAKAEKVLFEYYPEYFIDWSTVDDKLKPQPT